MEICNAEKHHQLLADLVEHLWSLKGHAWFPIWIFLFIFYFWISYLIKVCNKLFVCVNYVIFALHKLTCIDIWITFILNIILGPVFWRRVLGPPVWEPGPKILGGHTDAPKTDQPAPCRLPFWGRRWRCSKAAHESGTKVRTSLWHLSLRCPAAWFCYADFKAIFYL
jgi:hypothetical protein